VIAAIWTLAGEGEVFGRRCSADPEKILPDFKIPPVEKVLQ